MGQPRARECLGFTTQLGATLRVLCFLYPASPPSEKCTFSSRSHISCFLNRFLHVSGLLSAWEVSWVWGNPVSWGLETEVEHTGHDSANWRTRSSPIWTLCFLLASCLQNKFLPAVNESTTQGEFSVYLLHCVLSIYGSYQTTCMNYSTLNN